MVVELVSTPTREICARLSVTNVSALERYWLVLVSTAIPADIHTDVCHAVVLS